MILPKSVLKLKLLLAIALFSLSTCVVVGYVARLVSWLTPGVLLLLAVGLLLAWYFWTFYKQTREIVVIALAVVVLAGVVVCLP